MLGPLDDRLQLVAQVHGGEVHLEPDVVEAVALVGPPARCRERLAQYREAGVGLPIVTPRVRDGGGVAAVQDVIRACAVRA